MKSCCKAKSFQGRMSHRGSGKAVGETRVKSGSHGVSAGEVRMGLGKMRQGLTAAGYPHKQSSDGNGGK